MTSQLGQLRAVVSPSILAADFTRLGDECATVLGDGHAEWLHCDVMDGAFVPNISFGFPIISSLRKRFPDAFLDCHLMVENPGKWVEPLAKAGGSLMTFHIEAVESVDAARVLVDAIHDAGMAAGVAVKPGTELAAAGDLADVVDMVLIMTVEPGFGGQSFMPETMTKVETLRASHPQLFIQVDGGLSPKTVDTAAAAGANVIVAGSAVFKADDRLAVIDALLGSVSASLA
ncbi:ribulose-phosphate 3-epimerase [Thecamonas trahens ATCC 50062]|uniref:Ribulose-phosphate 3-epimerase n=1 Tax=Thecamonas trahens ATCC 50062 TaxID=461836 RepID=A0A0L0DVZ1_THETB|nr:ribulose-phosphate 3-epimerase [Thecamonas trahens ATCC 50062]KNC55683.1 ribulose-phosphate 3-epimerase [Thecamonas trahens ATCC 50062]|eukprot:XP_013761450.1 ribulose-phosphate 3-epimerase [Thecamonas trahens ATCC 50062]